MIYSLLIEGKGIVALYVLSFYAIFFLSFIICSDCIRNTIMIILFSVELFFFGIDFVVRLWIADKVIIVSSLQYCSSTLVQK